MAAATTPPTPDDTLDATQRVVHAYRQRLRQIAAQNADHPAFCSGIAWGLHALDRVGLALCGSPDPTLHDHLPVPALVPGRKAPAP